MSTWLSTNIIKDRCGTVSFKRGEAFYRQNKVQLKQMTSIKWEGVVTGGEDFHVTVTKTAAGTFKATCSCPKLASVKQDCQHIAAVLLAIAEQQAPKKGDSDLTHEFFTLFNDDKTRPIGHQRHFESRNVLDVEFICHGLTFPANSRVLGIEIVIEGASIESPRAFLQAMSEGRTYPVSPQLRFDPRKYCFQTETEAVIQQLTKIVGDEKIHDNKETPESCHNHPCILIIPPSVWHHLLSDLRKAPFVRLEYEGKRYQAFSITETALPVEFQFMENAQADFQLKINGLDQVMIFKDYHVVLFDGKLKQLDQQDNERLSGLVKLLENSQTDHIEIPKEQIGFFKEKVIVGLKNLGQVKVSVKSQQSMLTSPLKAKLYLDRIRNRLLAGLEFHYENYVIHPLEKRPLPAGILLIRDREKEEAILNLMEESQFTQTDGGYYLQNEELEFTFLTEILPKLQKQVQVYATTAVRNRVSKGSFRPSVRVRAKKERTNWLEFKFEMKGISDDEVREILQALDEKRKYFRLRNDTLLALETDDFDDLRRFLQSVSVKAHSLVDGFGLPLNASVQLLDSVDKGSFLHLEASIQSVFEHLKKPDQAEFEVPNSLKPILREYQIMGFKWLKMLAAYGFGGILADDMGLGKTIQSITYIVSELETLREAQKRILIVCPSALTYNWLHEVHHFAPDIQAMVIDGSQKERRDSQKASDQVDVIITSYPLLRRDINWYEKERFHTIFFDEAQAFKNPLTQTARTVKRLQADHRFALTGTPLENAIEELWAIFHVVFPELLLGLKEFSSLSHKQIKKRIRPFMLRRMKKDVLKELPKKKATMDVVDLLPEQKKLYTAYLAKLRHDTLKHLDRETRHRNRIKILAGITRLRQICCHPALFVQDYKGGSAKFNQLMEILREAKYSGRRVLIFSQFTTMLNFIGQKLTDQGRSYFYLDGQTSSGERLELCQRFNEGERDLFLISLKAGGTGLNLTSADTVILYDTWWNPAVENQATDRAHRMGQKNEVQVIKLVSRGTIEEKMNDLQEQKRLLIEETLDSEADFQTTLTEEELRELLMG